VARALAAMTSFDVQTPEFHAAFALLSEHYSSDVLRKIIAPIPIQTTPGFIELTTAQRTLLATQMPRALLTKDEIRAAYTADGTTTLSPDHFQESHIKTLMDLIDSRLSPNGPSCTDSLHLSFAKHCEHQGAVLYVNASSTGGAITDDFKYTPKLRSKETVDKSSLALEFDLKNVSAHASTFTIVDQNLHGELPEEHYCAFVELAQRNFAMLRSGTSAVTAEVYMRAEIWAAAQKFIYHTIMLLLAILAESDVEASFANARLRCGEFDYDNMLAIPNCVIMYLEHRYGFNMSLGARAYVVFKGAFKGISKDFGNLAISDLYGIAYRRGEGVLSLLTRVQHATRRAELAAFAPGTLGDSVKQLHPGTTPAAGLSVFFGALNAFKFDPVDRITQQTLLLQYKQKELTTWRNTSIGIIKLGGLLRLPTFVEPADGNASTAFYTNAASNMNGKGGKGGKGNKGIFDTAGKGGNFSPKPAVVVPVPGSARTAAIDRAPTANEYSAYASLLL